MVLQYTTGLGSICGRFGRLNQLLAHQNSIKFAAPIQSVHTGKVSSSSALTNLPVSKKENENSQALVPYRNASAQPSPSGTFGKQIINSEIC